MKEDTPRNDGDEESLVGALGSLPTEAEPSGELWPEIEAQLEPAAGVGADDAGLASAKPATLSSISYRPWLQAAAAIVIFMAGASSGLGRSSETMTPPASSMDEALALAAEVQRTGSEYIAALSAFTSVVESLSTDVRGQGTNAAFATLYNAADQLAALSAYAPNAAALGPDAVDGAERRIRF